MLSSNRFTGTIIEADLCIFALIDLRCRPLFSLLDELESLYVKNFRVKIRVMSVLLWCFEVSVVNIVSQLFLRKGRKLDPDY